MPLGLRIGNFGTLKKAWKKPVETVEGPGSFGIWKHERKHTFVIIYIHVHTYTYKWNIHVLMYSNIYVYIYRYTLQSAHCLQMACASLVYLSHSILGSFDEFVPNFTGSTYIRHDQSIYVHIIYIYMYICIAIYMYIYMYVLSIYTHIYICIQSIPSTLWFSAF